MSTLALKKRSNRAIGAYFRDNFSCKPDALVFNNYVPPGTPPQN